MPSPAPPEGIKRRLDHLDVAHRKLPSPPVRRSTAEGVSWDYEWREALPNSRRRGTVDDVSPDEKHFASMETGLATRVAHPLFRVTLLPATQAKNTGAPSDQFVIRLADRNECCQMTGVWAA